VLEHINFWKEQEAKAQHPERQVTRRPCWLMFAVAAVGALFGVLSVVCIVSWVYCRGQLSLRNSSSVVRFDACIQQC
jgi:hypothetical protein